MTHRRNFTILRASTVAALVLCTAPHSHGLQIVEASAQPPENNRGTEVHDRVAHDVTLRLSLQQGSASICRELLIRPRGAGPRPGCEQTGPLRGIVAIEGNGYEIEGSGCSPIGELHEAEIGIFSIN
jgi:hypothetical protein